MDNLKDDIEILEAFVDNIRIYNPSYKVGIDILEDQIKSMRSRLQHNSVPDEKRNCVVDHQSAVDHTIMVECPVCKEVLRR